MIELFIAFVAIGIVGLFLVSRFMGRCACLDERNVADKEIRSNRSGIFPKGFL